MAKLMRSKHDERQEASTVHALQDGKTAFAFRRFGILDLLVLILGLGPGLVALRHHWPMIAERFNRIDWYVLAFAGGNSLTNRHLAWFYQALVYCCLVGVFFLTFETLALLLLGFRKPRAPVRLLIRQPGTLALVIGLACFVAALAILPYLGHFSIVCAFVFLMPSLAIPAGWLTVKSKGLLVAEHTWIDRGGRWLGVLWISLSFAFGTIWILCFYGS